MDIEKVAIENPSKIKTTKINVKDEGPSKEEINEIISIFEFNNDQKYAASELVKSLYKIIFEKDAESN